MIKICSICLVLMIGGFVGCTKMRNTQTAQTIEVNAEEVEATETVAKVDWCEDYKN